MGRTAMLVVLLFLVAALPGCAPAQSPPPANPVRVDPRDPRLSYAHRGGIVAQPGPVAHPVGVVFGGSIELVGCSISNELPRREDLVAVTSVWRCLERVSVNYRIAPRVIHESKTTLFLAPDHDPDPPTSQWQPGQYYVHEFTFSFLGKDRLPLGTYILREGLYDPGVPVGNPRRFPSQPLTAVEWPCLTLLD